jgi:hypothetical protein
MAKPLRHRNGPPCAEAAARTSQTAALIVEAASDCRGMAALWWGVARFGVGFVVHGHGHWDRPPGRHEPIVNETEYRDALAGIEARKRGRGKAPSSVRRFYLLLGLAFCSCGVRMRGDGRDKGGKVYRCYGCPVSDGRGRYLGPSGAEISATSTGSVPK